MLFNIDPARANRLWMTTEYLPAFLELIEPRYREPGYWERELRSILGDVRLQEVPIPHDCRDGFLGAFWRRPERYLEPALRLHDPPALQDHAAAAPPPNAVDPRCRDCRR